MQYCYSNGFVAVFLSVNDRTQIQNGSELKDGCSAATNHCTIDVLLTVAAALARAIVAILAVSHSVCAFATAAAAACTLC
jgi:hypothetical protein